MRFTLIKSVLLVRKDVWAKSLQLLYVSDYRLLSPQLTQPFCLAPCQPTTEMEVAPLTWPWEESPQLRGGERYAAFLLGTTHTHTDFVTYAINSTLFFFSDSVTNRVVCLCATTSIGVLRCVKWCFFSVCMQLEFGAGDTHGPLLGMKIFRNLTPRLYV